MKKVVVLMSTYNGEEYLVKQLESLFAQEGVEVELLVRDDGSSDGTREILRRYEDLGQLKWYEGKNLKPALSFMDLVLKAPQSEYYAFCDQDDIWDKNKLQVAVSKIEASGNEVSTIYFSNARLVDGEGNNLSVLRLSPRLTVGSALMINPVIGCTAVFNNALLGMLRRFEHKKIYMHDSWAYRLCIATGGKAIFDPVPHISYRQHGRNVIGAKSSLLKRYQRRFSNAVLDRRCIRMHDAAALVDGYLDVMPERNQKLVKAVAFYKSSFFGRFRLALNKEFRTNKVEHNVAFILSVLLGAF